MRSQGVLVFALFFPLSKTKSFQPNGIFACREGCVMPRQQSGAVALCAQETEWETFFRLITHDDRNSYYVVSSDAGESWTDTAVKKESLPALGFNAKANYYMTHNGFTSCCRKAEGVRQLNALFFDLDCHDRPAAETRSIVKKAIATLRAAVHHNDLPHPTMLIDSGRGVQLFYVLERSIPCQISHKTSYEKSLWLFQHVQKGLANILHTVLAGVAGISVDRATFDVSRVSRIPGTFNTKAGRFATLVNHADNFYSLSDLGRFVAQKQAASEAPLRKSFARSATVLSYQPLMMSRLGKLMELQKHRQFDCSGTRELMSFVFYNTAVQIYSRPDAVERLHAFNGKFTHPLAKQELKGIVDSVDSVTNMRGERGYYLIGAKRLTELLALTTEEILALNFFESKRDIQRRESKRQTAEKRKERNLKIVNLRSDGFTHKEIAQELHCSVRTVASVLHDAALTKQRGKRSYSYTANKDSLYNIISKISYNKKHPIQCNFLSYESMEWLPRALQPVFSSLGTPMTKTSFPVTFVTIQEVLIRYFSELLRAFNSLLLLRYVRLLC